MKNLRESKEGGGEGWKGWPAHNSESARRQNRAKAKVAILAVKKEEGGGKTEPARVKAS